MLRCFAGFLPCSCCDESQISEAAQDTTYRDTANESSAFKLNADGLIDSNNHQQTIDKVPAHLDQDNAENLTSQDIRQVVNELRSSRAINILVKQSDTNDRNSKVTNQNKIQIQLTSKLAADQLIVAIRTQGNQARTIIRELGGLRNLVFLLGTSNDIATRLSAISALELMCDKDSNGVSISIGKLLNDANRDNDIESQSNQDSLSLSDDFNKIAQDVNSNNDTDVDVFRKLVATMSSSGSDSQLARAAGRLCVTIINASKTWRPTAIQKFISSGGPPLLLTQLRFSEAEQDLILGLKNSGGSESSTKKKSNSMISQTPWRDSSSSSSAMSQSRASILQTERNRLCGDKIDVLCNLLDYIEDPVTETLQIDLIRSLTYDGSNNSDCKRKLKSNNSITDAQNLRSTLKDIINICELTSESTLSGTKRIKTGATDDGVSELKNNVLEVLNDLSKLGLQELMDLMGNVRIGSVYC